MRPISGQAKADSRLSGGACKRGNEDRTSEVTNAKIPSCHLVNEGFMTLRLARRREIPPATRYSAGWASPPASRSEICTISSLAPSSHPSELRGGAALAPRSAPRALISEARLQHSWKPTQGRTPSASAEGHWNDAGCDAMPPSDKQ